MSEDDRARPATRRVAVTAAAVAWVVLASYGVAVSGRATGGFLACYTGARLAREGWPGPRVYDDASFMAEAAKDAPGVKDIFRPNPPTMPFLLLPVVSLGLVPARRAVTAAVLATLAASAILLARRLPRGPGWHRPAFALVVALWAPAWANVRDGQAYTGLLLLAVLFLLGPARPVAGGVPLGLSAGLKTAYPLLWLVPLVRRRARLLAVAAGTAGALAVASLAFADAATWKAYLAALGSLGSRPELAVTAYQTQVGLVHRLFAGDATWNPAPLLDAPGLAQALSLLLLVATAALVAWLARPSGREDLAVAGALLASLAHGPLSLDYHFALALAPAAVLWGELARRGSRPLRLAYGAGLALVGLPWPLLAGAHGAALLLAYPRLAGGWLLLALCAVLSRRGSAPADGSLSPSPVAAGGLPAVVPPGPR